MKIKFLRKSILRDGQEFNPGDIIDLEPELGARMIEKGRAIKSLPSGKSGKRLEKNKELLWQQ